MNRVPSISSLLRAAIGAGLGLVLTSGAVAARTGSSFTYKDWSLDCDNTGTCRASGYSAETDDTAASVLITRLAGAGAAIDVQLAFGGQGEQGEPPEGPVRMTVAGHPAGTVVGGRSVSPAQAAALLKAFLGNGAVAFAAGGGHWRVSGDGAAAVLLKMDDVQGRVGTPGALVKKGDRPEAAVPGPARPPVIQAVRVAPSSPSDRALALRVLASVPKNDDDCPLLAELPAAGKGDADGVELWRLGGGRVLVSTTCWQAAYNAGNGYWIARDKPPYDAKLVTAQADSFAPELGELSSTMKGRGVGDCMSTASWVWDGQAFVHATETTTGQCRGVAPGGAWDLPTLVSEVRKPR